jgi:DNA-binding transcriptional LysR family regulator
MRGASRLLQFGWEFPSRWSAGGCCGSKTELGVQLLARSTRGAALTEAGATYRDFAARICAELDVAKETILPDGDLRGRLRIAAPLTFGPTHFAPMLAELARRHPQLQMQTCYSDRFVDLIAEGYDCAIRVGYLEDSNLIARRVGAIYGKLVASPGYVAAHGSPETPEELGGHEALMQGTEAWQLIGWRPGRHCSAARALQGRQRHGFGRRCSGRARDRVSCPTGSP